VIIAPTEENLYFLDQNTGGLGIFNTHKLKTKKKIHRIYKIIQMEKQIKSVNIIPNMFITN